MLEPGATHGRRRLTVHMIGQSLATVTVVGSAGRGPFIDVGDAGGPNARGLLSLCRGILRYTDHTVPPLSAGDGEAGGRGSSTPSPLVAGGRGGCA